ncbi:MAG: sialidase [Haloplanus sp.]
MTSRPLSLVAAVVVVAAALAGPASVATAAQVDGQVLGQPDVQLFASSAEFDAGQQADLNLVVSNDGRIDKGGEAKYEERVTTARGMVLEIRDGSVPIEVDAGPIAVGEVPRGTTPVDPVSITVPEGTAPGTYRVPIRVSYSYTRAVLYGPYETDYHDFKRHVTRYVTIRVRSDARFEVVDTASSAQVDDRGSLAVTVEHVGTEPASDATVALRSSSDELRFGTGSTSSTAYVGSWDPGERRTLEYTVALSDEATVREYALSATVDYRDPDGIARTSRPLKVGLRPAAEQSFSLGDVNATLRAGEDGTVSGTVVNDGPRPVDAPVVRFASNNPHVTVDTAEYALPDLDPGERAAFHFDVEVSDAATESTQQANFSVRYRNERGNTRLSDPLQRTVTIDSSRDRFTVAAVNRTLVAGRPRALDVRVTNNGDEPLRNVEAKAFVRDPLSSDDDEALVPTLAPGESKTFTVGMGAGAGALDKTYPVSLDFQYELPDGDTRVSKTYTVPVDVVHEERPGFVESLPFSTLGMGAAALAVLGGVVWWRRNGD